MLNGVVPPTTPSTPKYMDPCATTGVILRASQESIWLCWGQTKYTQTVRPRAVALALLVWCP